LLIQISHRDIGASLRGLLLFVKTHKAMSRAPYLDKATASTTRLLRSIVLVEAGIRIGR
jgi:hypothetical protein